MKVFIDFDDVIFNTKQFKDDLRDVFVRFGISNELYEKTYYDFRDTHEVKVYDPRAQVERIKKIESVDSEKLLEAIDSFMCECSRYVFSDVWPFFEFVGRDNVQVISYGDANFQAEKIKSSGIKDHIKNIFITDKLKAVMMGDVLSELSVGADERIFFLDDRIEQISDVKGSFPQIVTILVKRPEGRYQEMQKEECCDWEVHNLDEAGGILSK